jgi:endoglucanase
VSDTRDGFFARVVRLTVFPERWLPDPELYLFDHLIPAVDHATSHGLYVIVDWHEIDDVAVVAERTSAFWRYVAPVFADYSNVAYEIFNEPVDSDNPSWSNWKRYAQPWVDQIRVDAPHNLILIGGPFWSQAIGPAATDPFVGDNLVYVGHIYPIIDPYTWSDYGPMAEVAAVRPLFITEWGFRNDGNEIWNGTRQSFGEPLRAFVEARGLSWTAWCADSRWAPEMFDENWELLTGDGEMGEFVKDWLAERRDEDQPAN